MANEKRGRGIFVAILGFCHITINGLNFKQIGWSKILNTIIYYCSLNDTTLNKGQKFITTTTHTIWRPYPQLFQLKKQNTPNCSFQGYLMLQKMLKWVMLINRYPKHDPGTRTEIFNPMWLLVGEHGERKMR